MPEMAPAERLAHMIVGNWVSQLIYVAAELDIAGKLKDGPKSVDDLATATKTHRGSLFRVLRALASLGLFAEQKDGRFSMTPMAEALREDVPGSQRAMAMMNGGWLYPAWGRVLDSVKTGETAFPMVYGKPIFDWLKENETAAKIFDGAMVGAHGREAGAVVESYDFAGINMLADVGGGNGSLLTAILNRHRSMRGLLFDLPGVIERAKSNLNAAGLAERCDTASGSFFEAVPGGADAYMMRHIIHDWTDDQCVTILGAIHRAMKPTAKLLIIESVIPPGNDPSFGKLLDITMLVAPGGKERSEAEYHKLLARGGFKIERIVPTSAEVSVIEAVKV